MAKKVFTDESLATFVNEIKAYTDDAISTHDHTALKIQHIPYGTDFNTLTQAGVYAPTQSYLADYINIPAEFTDSSDDYSQFFFYLEVTRGAGENSADGEWIIQKLTTMCIASMKYSYGETMTYTRTGFGMPGGDIDSWNSWSQVINSGNIGAQSVKYATSAGSANSADKLTTARNINGVSFDGTSDITVYSPTQLPTISKHITEEGWYRVASCTDCYGAMTMVINTSFNYSDATQAELDIAIGYGSAHDDGVNILQTSAINKGNISKVRICKGWATGFCIDVYYAVNVRNYVSVSFTDVYPNAANLQTEEFTNPTIPEGYTVKEFTLEHGATKASKFVGDLEGNVTIDSTLKFKNALIESPSVTVLPTFIDNDSANGIGYIPTSNVSVGRADSAGSATVAAYLGANGNVNSPMQFIWSGQEGQPAWLFGGDTFSSIYVYNPANFSVNHANTAGSATKATQDGNGNVITDTYIPKWNPLLPDDRDIDTVDISGFYRVSNNPNLPAGAPGYGQLIVSRGADTITQIYSSYSTGDLYTRSGNPSYVGGTGGWTSWTQLINDHNIGGQTVAKAGVADHATLLKPTHNTAATIAQTSKWEANTAEHNGKIVWGESFRNDAISTDSGDMLLWLSAGTNGNATQLNMTTDGDIYVQQNKKVATTEDVSNAIASAITTQHINDGTDFNTIVNSGVYAPTTSYLSEFYNIPEGNFYNSTFCLEVIRGIAEYSADMEHLIQKLTVINWDDFDHPIHFTRVGMFAAPSGGTEVMSWGKWCQVNPSGDVPLANDGITEGFNYMSLKIKIIIKKLPPQNSGMITVFGTDEADSLRIGYGAAEGYYICESTGGHGSFTENGNYWSMDGIRIGSCFIFEVSSAGATITTLNTEYIQVGYV